MALNLQKLNNAELVLADDNSLQVIFDHISNGGTLKEICDMWGIQYVTILNRLRNNPDLSKRLAQAEADRDLYFKDVIINEYKNIATVNIKDALNEDGLLKSAVNMPSSLTAAIKEIDSDGGIKFHDKVKSLETLGKQVGMFVEKKEIKATFTLEQAATRAVENAAKRKAAQLALEEEDK